MSIIRHGKLGALGELAIEAGRTQRQAQIDDQVARGLAAQGALEQRRGFQLTDADRIRQFAVEDQELAQQRRIELKQLDREIKALDRESQKEAHERFIGSLTGGEEGTLSTVYGITGEKAGRMLAIQEEHRRGGLTSREAYDILQELAFGNATGRKSQADLARIAQDKLDASQVRADEKLAEANKRKDEQAEQKEQQKVLDARAKELQPLPSQIRKLRSAMVQARRKITSCLAAGEEKGKIAELDSDILEAYDEIKGILDVFAPELSAQLPEAGDKPNNNVEIDAVKAILPQLTQIVKDARQAASGQAPQPAPTTQPEGIQPTKEQAEEFYRQANGDPILAEQLAKEAGFVDG